MAILAATFSRLALGLYAGLAVSAPSSADTVSVADAVDRGARMDSVVIVAIKSLYIVVGICVCTYAMALLASALYSTYREKG